MEKWFITNKKADFKAIGERFGISPITAKIIRNRDIVGDDAIRKYLTGRLKDLHNPWEMKDMDKLVETLKEAIDNGRKIRVVQDYDVDGCMSGCILVLAIKECGGIADWDVPDRTAEGYGINQRIVDDAVRDGIDTIITCDNGIAANDVIKYGADKGLNMIVTDHHEVQYVIKDGEYEYLVPEAKAVVDPKRHDCPYPFKQLCGAGISYKVSEVLFETYGLPHEETKKFLQYAAIATVCDVVDLTDENRIIVKEGFRLLEDTDNYGMRALLDRCLKPGESLSVGRVGFFIGPVINAGGRMATAKRVMELLFSESREEAEIVVDDLIKLNEERKAETEKAVTEIVDSFTEMPNEDVIIEYNPDCHESVAGIAAGRIKDRYYKPTIVLTKSSEDGLIKGSARSVTGFDIFERLMTVKDLLLRFGGHPMAAGMTLRESDLEEFRRRMNAPAWPESADRFKRITIDAAVRLAAINKNVIRELELIEPCGKENKRPVFAAKNLKVSHFRILGKKRNAVKMTLSDDTASIDGIWFGNSDDIVESIKEKYGDIQCQRLLKGYDADVFTDIIYTPAINYYNGFESIQLDISSFRW